MCGKRAECDYGTIGGDNFFLFRLFPCVQNSGLWTQSRSPAIPKYNFVSSRQTLKELNPGCIRISITFHSYGQIWEMPTFLVIFPDTKSDQYPLSGFHAHRRRDGRGDFNRHYPKLRKRIPSRSSVSCRGITKKGTE
jgi:hypothetical protein